jgi:hypothetical protein
VGGRRVHPRRPPRWRGLRRLAVRFEEHPHRGTAQGPRRGAKPWIKDTEHVGKRVRPLRTPPPSNSVVQPRSSRNTARECRRRSAASGSDHTVLSPVRTASDPLSGGRLGQTPPPRDRPRSAPWKWAMEQAAQRVRPLSLPRPHWLPTLRHIRCVTHPRTSAIPTGERSHWPPVS